MVHTMQSFLDDPQTIDLKVAYHEAGHYVVGRRMGFDVDGIRLTSKFGFVGVVLFRPIPSIEACLDLIRRRILSLFAGALSESGALGDLPSVAKARDSWASTASDDDAKARELASLSFSLKAGQTLETLAPTSEHYMASLDQMRQDSLKAVLADFDTIKLLATTFLGKKKSGGARELLTPEINALHEIGPWLQSLGEPRGP